LRAIETSVSPFLTWYVFGTLSFPGAARRSASDWSLTSWSSMNCSSVTVASWRYRLPALL
jgi:hypothetical protein